MKKCLLTESESSADLYSFCLPAQIELTAGFSEVPLQIILVFCFQKNILFTMIRVEFCQGFFLRVQNRNFRIPIGKGTGKAKTVQRRTLNDKTMPDPSGSPGDHYAVFMPARPEEKRQSANRFEDPESGEIIDQGYKAGSSLFLYYMNYMVSDNFSFTKFLPFKINQP